MFYWLLIILYPSRFTPKIRKEVRKPPPLTEPTSKFVAKKLDVTPAKKPPQESDSDDGLEPLPFPDPDEPIPDLEENKDEEFVLDPETGKLVLFLVPNQCRCLNK